MQHDPLLRNLVVSTDPNIYENTDCFGKIQAAVIQQGVAATIEYTLRDRSHQPLDLAGIFLSDNVVPYDNKPRKENCDNIWEVLHNLNPDYYDGKSCAPVDQYYIEVRFQPADEPKRPIWIVSGDCVRPKEGVIHVDVPLKVSDTGGIFVANCGILRKADHRPVFIDKFLVSVERSAWRNNDNKMPTLTEIRSKIMDTDTENLLQGYVEFTTSDILDAVVSAVRAWNSEPPHLERWVMTCSTFGWHDQWCNKIIANLYSRAALRYERNKLLINHGGMQGDDLDRGKVYQAIAQQYEQVWKEWLKIKKREVNLAQFTSVMSSPYWRCVNSQ